MANDSPMSDPLHIRVSEGERILCERSLTEPLELGRQQVGEPDAYAWLPARDSTPARLIIARQDVRDNVSRRHAVLEPLSSGCVRVTNRSKGPLACAAAAGGSIAAGAAAELTPPFALVLPGRTVSVGYALPGR